MYSKNNFNINVNKLQEQQISVLKAIYKEGNKHLKEYYASMQHFKYPEKRVRCFDTKYFEEALPVISGILREYEQNKLNKNG